MNLSEDAKRQGGLITKQDLANWKPIEEEPTHVNYKGIDVYKLQQWTQGPSMLQALNILENFDLKSMGYNSVKYINTVYQAMSMAFAESRLLLWRSEIQSTNTDERFTKQGICKTSRKPDRFN